MTQITATLAVSTRSCGRVAEDTILHHVCTRKYTMGSEIQTCEDFKSHFFTVLWLDRPNPIVKVLVLNNVPAE